MTDGGIGSSSARIQILSIWVVQLICLRGEKGDFYNPDTDPCKHHEVPQGQVQGPANGLQQFPSLYTLANDLQRAWSHWMIEK